MTKFAHSVMIKRPLEDVWAYVIEPANDPVWLGPVIEVRGGAGVPLEVGSEIQQVAQFLGRRFEVTLVVTEHEPMRRSSVRASASPVPVTGSYTFDPVDGGTRFSMEGETDAHGLFKLAEPVFARMARREWASSCEVLKELLEAGAKPGTP
jgi:hypothetical protein